MNECGYVYCVTSPLFSGVKIGGGKSTVKKIHSRYREYYGNNLELFVVSTYNPFIVKKMFKNFFSNKKITNEIYKKNFLNEYVKFMKDNAITYVSFDTK